MARFAARRKAFREVLEGEVCVYPGSVFDPLSARIAEEIGFEVGMFAGSVASQVVLGAPASPPCPSRIPTCRPVIAPAAQRSSRSRKAAIEARAHPDLVIAGRTSGAEITSIDDAVVRVKAYEETGVDCLFLVGVKTREDIEKVAAATTLPLILGGVPADVMMDRDFLSGHRVRVCLQGHQPIQAALEAVRATLQALRDGSAPADLPGLPDKDLLARAMDSAAWKRRGDDWL